MAITIDAQIEVNGTAVANGSYRHIVGPVSCAVSTSGQKILACEFILEGSTPEELATRWAATKAELDLLDPRVVLWIDRTNQTTPTEDIRAGDGLHGSVTTRVAFEPMRTQTGYAYACVFHASTDLLTPQRISGSTSPRVPFKGQASEVDLAVIYNAGARASRVLKCKFTSTVDTSGYGPFTLSTTVNVAGKAKFTLVGALPAFADGMTILLSGTTNYNGPHRVISIVGQNVLTDTNWLAADAAGTAYLSAVTTGEGNYITARDSLLNDFLLVEDSGAYLGTEGLALTGEAFRQLDKDGYTIEVMLSADYMPAALTALPSARQFHFQVKKTIPSEWSMDSGESAPVAYQVDGSYGVDADVLGATALQSTWNTVKSQVLSAVTSQLGETARIVSAETILDPTSMTVRFLLLLANSGATALDFSYSEMWAFNLVYRSWKIKNGKHHVQIEPGPQECTVAITVTRKGFNEVNMASLAPAPSQGGFMFLPTGSGDGRSDRLTTAAGETLYVQSYSITYARLNTSVNEVIPFQPAVKP